MYRGNNPTAIQSQQWLEESLFNLMKEKPYTEITILDICKGADLSRQTFYNFYSSKEELLRFYLQKQYEAQFSKYQEKERISIKETVEAFSLVLTDNAALLSSMLQNGLDGIIADEISKCISLFADRFCNDCHAKDTLPYSEALLSGALAHLLVFWFRQDIPISLEKLNGILTDFFNGKLYTFS